MDDVSDFLIALRSMPPSELASYLEAMLGDAQAAREIAVDLGAPVEHAEDAAQATTNSLSVRPTGAGFYKKGDLEEEEDGIKGRRKGKKGGGAKDAQSSFMVPAAAPPTAGGVKVKAAKPTKGRAVKMDGLGALESALLPGRHPCQCNARRHALITNWCGNHRSNPVAEARCEWKSLVHAHGMHPSWCAFDSRSPLALI